MTCVVCDVYYAKYTSQTRGLMPNAHIGEFEQMVLLALIQCGDQAYAPNIRQVLEERAGRSVSRGALYRTFDRLERKGHLAWDLEDGSPIPERGGRPMRRFRVTKDARALLRVSRTALLKLWDGIEAELGQA